MRGLELRQGDCAEDAVRATVLTRARLGHVESLEIEKPAPGPSDVLVKVLACGVCRTTDLHVIDGELPNTAIPIVPGHKIVGRVEAVGYQQSQKRHMACFHPE